MKTTNNLKKKWNVFIGSFHPSFGRLHDEPWEEEEDFEGKKVKSWRMLTENEFQIPI